nr:MAG TPA: hypothetical protein [Caudoviricetes sp.]DAX27531.1 MAG TPA: hypothetical protein [Caudoviricetes sp.]
MNLVFRVFMFFAVSKRIKEVKNLNLMYFYYKNSVEI